MNNVMREFQIVSWLVVVFGTVAVNAEFIWAQEGTVDSGVSKQSADALAREVARQAGDPQDVERLKFTFVVEVNGQEKVRRRHTWWPGEEKLKIERGEKVIQLAKLGEFDLSKMAKSPDTFEDEWAEVAPDVPAKQAAKAWGWFINDNYWLFAPAKLFDAGVNRRLDAQGRLILTFGDVGLTPGDTYALTVDEERDVVTRWSYELQSGREGTFRWENYKQYGPLLLSTRRESVGGDKNVVIRFEEIVVE